MTFYLILSNYVIEKKLKEVCRPSKVLSEGPRCARLSGYYYRLHLGAKAARSPASIGHGAEKMQTLDPGHPGASISS